MLMSSQQRPLPGRSCSWVLPKQPPFHRHRLAPGCALTCTWALPVGEGGSGSLTERKSPELLLWDDDHINSEHKALLCAQHCPKHAAHMNLFNPLDETKKCVYFYAHFTDKETVTEQSFFGGCSYSSKVIPSSHLPLNALACQAFPTPASPSPWLPSYCHLDVPSPATQPQERLFQEASLRLQVQ